MKKPTNQKLVNKSEEYKKRKKESIVESYLEHDGGKIDNKWKVTPKDLEPVDKRVATIPLHNT